MLDKSKRIEMVGYNRTERMIIELKQWVACGGEENKNKN